eukprot:546019_1
MPALLIMNVKQIIIFNLKWIIFARSTTVYTDNIAEKKVVVGAEDKLDALAFVLAHKSTPKKEPPTQTMYQWMHKSLNNTKKINAFNKQATEWTKKCLSIKEQE